MKNTYKLFLLALLSVNSVFALAATAVDGVSVENGYVRGLPPTVKNTSAYMTIINSSDQPLNFIGAKSDIALSVMIHRTEQKGTMMSMHHVMSLSVPAHGKLVLEPGGTHLMIMGLHAPVSDGATVELVLLFDGGLEYSLHLPVRSVLAE